MSLAPLSLPCQLPLRSRSACSLRACRFDTTAEMVCQNVASSSRKQHNLRGARTYVVHAGVSPLTQPPHHDEHSAVGVAVRESGTIPTPHTTLCFHTLIFPPVRLDEALIALFTPKGIYHIGASRAAPFLGRMVLWTAPSAQVQSCKPSLKFERTSSR